MTYVVTDACIKCKYTDCVEVCPVDCFYEGENMLVINPSANASIAACASRNARPRRFCRTPKAGWKSGWNSTPNILAEWPNITEKKDPPGRRG